FQAGVARLELLQLVEAAAQGARVPRVGDAVDAVRGRVRHVVVGVAVTDRALSIGDVAERVVDHVELAGAAAALDVLREVLALVDAPFGEVPDELVAATARAGRRARGWAGRRLRGGWRAGRRLGCGGRGGRRRRSAAATAWRTVDLAVG